MPPGALALANALVRNPLLDSSYQFTPAGDCVQVGRFEFALGSAYPLERSSWLGAPSEVKGTCP